MVRTGMVVAAGGAIVVGLALWRRLRHSAEDVAWLPVGKRYAFEELVFWKGKEAGVSFADAIKSVDTVVLGPHAGAAFPSELRPYVSPKLTIRKQFDFSDVATDPLGRAWAASDAHVVFISCPHSRAVMDPNRAHTEASFDEDLRECFSRLRRMRAGEKGVSLAGKDAIRVCTFSLEDVWLEPQSEEGWREMCGAFREAFDLAVGPYEAAVDRVLDAVLDAHRGKQQPLTVIGLHDTNNYKMRADGALVVERPPNDRLPVLVNFGNKGDSTGELLGEDSDASPALIGGDAVRRLAGAWRTAFDADRIYNSGHAQDFLKPATYAYEEPISFNRPYKGGHEVVRVARRLRQAAMGDKAYRAVLNSVQVEFERTVLLGPKAAAEICKPGCGWPAVDEANVQWVAGCLARTMELYRSS